MPSNDAKLKIKFLSKAETLEQLVGVIEYGKILPLYKLSVRQFLDNSILHIREIMIFFQDEDYLVVRSSAKNEDTNEASNAGRYLSVLNVIKKEEYIISAIEQVISSYLDNADDHLVFIQPALKNIKIAGVAMTSDLATRAPYYIVNFDDSGSTDSITSGTGNYKTYIHYKFAPEKIGEEQFKPIINALRELENVCGHEHLDIEFAIDCQDNLYIMQVRPIVNTGKEDLSHLNFAEALFRAHSKIKKLSSHHPNLLGDKAIYGVMPDWNPAEIIGFKPKTLAASLYKEIITDNIWAYQRDNYGYRNLRSHPLKILYLGIPYIDVRVDFNSFIPKNLNENTAKKLVNFYLDKLAANPVMHDKVEFEIVHSCYYFNLPEILDTQLRNIFSKTEIEKIKIALLELTNKIIKPGEEFYRKDAEKIEILKQKYELIVNSKLALVDKIYWLLEDCKRYGTLPFAGIARSAFIATQLLKSLVEIGIISREERDKLINSFNTITKQLNSDTRSLYQRKTTKEQFLELYGHLRPGTYDILSPRYDADFDTYFTGFNPQNAKNDEFFFTRTQIKQIDELIKQNNMQTDSEHLMNFIRGSIEGREYAKFIFTKSLSQAIKYIEELAVKYGVAKNDLAYLDIKTILNLYASVDFRCVNEIFEMDIKKNKKSYEYTKAVRLPTLILHPNDIYCHTVYPSEPNYITTKTVNAPIVSEYNLTKADLYGKIIFIKSADPGYDFLFSKHIGGLVTLFGGANSHMAVRCAELGIPAIIGAGEKNYKNWSCCKLLKIDCLNKKVINIS